VQAQPGLASHENAFPDALELRDAMKMPGSLFEKEKKPKNTTGIERCPNPLESLICPVPDTTLVECIERFI